MVIQCRTHQISFTLYPPAYTPYARRPVQKLAPDGSPVHAEGEGLHREFSDTLFAAALDGEAGRAWIREGEGTSVPSWTTQSRHLSRAARLIGIASDLGDRVRETIAAALSVGNLLLRERAAAKGFRAVGKAVCDILRSIRGGRRKAFSLLTCGHLAGLWGIPLHWDARRKALERSPFCDAGTVRVT